MTVFTTVKTVTIITIVSVTGIFLIAFKLDQSNVPIETINMTPTNAAIGICTRKPCNETISVNKNVPATNVDKRPLPPD